MKHVLRPWVTAVIPARGGSRGIPGKNLKEVGGRSLVVRAVDAAMATTGIDEVVVSTDAPSIAVAAARAGAQVIRRPRELASDTASSESALLHALDLVRPTPDVLVFIQPTSPFIDPSDLGRAVALVASESCDVAFSVTASHDFLWRQGPNGPLGVNHDAAVRLRRQDRASEYRETGAFYVMRTAGFAQARHRFFGRVEFVEVDARDAIEIDDPADLDLARRMADLRLTHIEQRK